MAMPTVNDEILDPSLQPDPNPRYTIRDNKGNIIHDNIQIEMKTPVVQNGTALNKAFFTKLYNTIMADASELVVDYTSTKDTKTIEITGLDLNADGGIYDVIVSGKGDITGLRINGISDEVYSVDGNSDTVIDIGIGGNHGGVAHFIICKENNEIFINGVYATHGNYNTELSPLNMVGGAVTADNLTSIQIVNTSTSTSLVIDAGFNIKIYKRR